MSLTTALSQARWGNIDDSEASLRALSPFQLEEYTPEVHDALNFLSQVVSYRGLMELARLTGDFQPPVELIVACAAAGEVPEARRLAQLRDGDGPPESLALALCRAGAAAAERDEEMAVRLLEEGRLLLTRHALAISTSEGLPWLAIGYARLGDSRRVGEVMATSGGLPGRTTVAVCEAFAKGGHWNAALNLANQADSECMRLDYLTPIVYELAAQQQFPKAVSIVRSALPVQYITPFPWFAAIATRQAEAQQFDDAYRTLEWLASIREEDPAEVAAHLLIGIADISAVLASAGRQTQVHPFLRLSEWDAGWYISAVCSAAQEQSRHGMRQEALATLGYLGEVGPRFGWSDDQQGCLPEHARDFVSLGHDEAARQIVDWAVDLANDCADDDVRARELVACGEILLTIGDLGAASRLYRGLSREFSRRSPAPLELVTQVVSGLGRAGDLQEAETQARRALHFAASRKPRKRREALAMISKSLAWGGLPELAMDVVDMIDDREARHQAISDVAVGEVARGNAPSSLVLIPGTSQIPLLEKLVLAQAAAGFHTEAVANTVALLPVESAIHALLRIAQRASYDEVSP